MEDKIAVIYKSKYGSTKRYAGWIALKLNGDLYEVSDIRDKDLLEYNTIIYGGPLYAGKIKGLNFIKKNYENIKDKEIIIFMVGINSPNEDYIETTLNNNISEDIRNNVKTFYFRGSMNYNELRFTDKILMKGLKKSISSKAYDKISEDEKLILKSCEEPISFCDKKSIDDLIRFINITNEE